MGRKAVALLHRSARREGSTLLLRIGRREAETSSSPTAQTCRKHKKVMGKMDGIVDAGVEEGEARAVDRSAVVGDMDASSDGTSNRRDSQTTCLVLSAPSLPT